MNKSVCRLYILKIVNNFVKPTDERPVVVGVPHTLWFWVQQSGKRQKNPGGYIAVSDWGEND